MPQTRNAVEPYFSTNQGTMYLGDAVQVLQNEVADSTVDLIVTSPPFGLIRKKDYGNVDASDYVDWFRRFAPEFRRVLKDTGSLVIDIGGAWQPGTPTRSLYHFKLLVMLCEEFDFHLAQEFFWWNPSKLPTPAEWVTVRRIRVKDALNCVWWLSTTPWPRASNRRVLQPYSDSQLDLFRDGYQAKKRPSGHDISDNFSNRNQGAIPPNLLAIPNTESNTYYLNYCEKNDITPHPARFPSELPEFFVRMCTDPDDLVIDPFAGSCVTGAICERAERSWICIDKEEEYLEGAQCRFHEEALERESGYSNPDDAAVYKLFRPGFGWNQGEDDPLPEDGGRSR